MFPDATHDEQALQSYIKTLRVHASRYFHDGNRRILEEKIEPQVRRRHNRQPTRKEMREAFAKEPQHQWSSAMLRTTQEMLYDTVGPSIERQLPELIQKAKSLEGKLGSLTLDDSVEVPPYLAAVDMHCKPGSYQQEITADDVFPGAEFDRTFRLYSMGGLGPNLDAQGWTLISVIKERYPDLKPRRILDLGCTVGHSTLPYTQAFGDDVEVHAIDVAAPCLRYAHARAVAMGRAVHFSQQDAAATNFPDDYFDLIVSHAFLHETSKKAVREIHKECHRILAKGGVLAHLDGIAPDRPYDKYYAEWMAHYNNEPYLGTVQDEDFAEIYAQASFPKKSVMFSYVQTKLELHKHDERAVGINGVISGRK
jgi:ubiquinone/menaquinone biosynthesis C-methylase UbiE